MDIRYTTGMWFTMDLAGKMKNASEEERMGKKYITYTYTGFLSRR